MLRLTAPAYAIWDVLRVVIVRFACRNLCVVLVATSHDADISVLAPRWAHHFEAYHQVSRLIKIVQDSAESRLGSIGAPSDDELHLANGLCKTTLLRPLRFRYIRTAL